MVDKNKLEQAIELELKDLNKDLERDISLGRSSEIIYVPVIVEIDDNGKVGSMQHSNIMKSYNYVVNKEKYSKE